MIENEFGEVGIDEALLGGEEHEEMQSEEEIIEMMNGCMRCTVRQDLASRFSQRAHEARQVWQAQARRDRNRDRRPGWPTPLRGGAQAFFVDDDVQSPFRSSHVSTASSRCSMRNTSSDNTWTRRRRKASRTRRLSRSGRLRRSHAAQQSVSWLRRKTWFAFEERNTIR